MWCVLLSPRVRWEQKIILRFSNFPVGRFLFSFTCFECECMWAILHSLSLARNWKIISSILFYWKGRKGKRNSVETLTKNGCTHTFFGVKHRWKLCYFYLVVNIFNMKTLNLKTLWLAKGCRLMQSAQDKRGEFVCCRR